MEDMNVLPSDLLKMISTTEEDQAATADFFRKTLARQSEPFGIRATPPSFKSAADEARAHLDSVKELFQPRFTASKVGTFGDPLEGFFKAVAPEPITYIHVDSQPTENSLFGFAALVKKPTSTNWDTEDIPDSKIEKFANDRAAREQQELLRLEKARLEAKGLAQLATEDAITKAILAIDEQGEEETETEFFARVDRELIRQGHKPVLTSQS
jgi:hypothetical protein